MDLKWISHVTSTQSKVHHHRDFTWFASYLILWYFFGLNPIWHPLQNTLSARLLDFELKQDVGTFLK